MFTDESVSIPVALANSTNHKRQFAWALVEIQRCVAADRLIRFGSQSNYMLIHPCGRESWRNSDFVSEVDNIGCTSLVCLFHRMISIGTIATEAIMAAEMLKVDKSDSVKADARSKKFRGLKSELWPNISL